MRHNYVLQYNNRNPTAFNAVYFLLGCSITETPVKILNQLQTHVCQQI